MKTALSLPLGYSDSGLLLQTSLYICFSFIWRILIPNSSFTDLSLLNYAGKGKAARVKGGINEEKCRAGLQPTTEPSLPNTFPPSWPTPPCPGHNSHLLLHRIRTCGWFDWSLCVGAVVQWLTTLQNSSCGKWWRDAGLSESSDH